MAAIISYVLVLIAFISIVSLVSSDASDNENFVLVTTKGLAKKIDSKSSENDKGREGNRKRRDISSSEKMDILDTINNLRRTVGASDMLYLYWSDQLESDLATWTAGCSYDFILFVSGDNSASYIKGASAWKSNFPVNMTHAFNDTRFAYMMKSVYVSAIAAYETFCPYATVGFLPYRNVYISAVGFVTESKFNDSVPQYSIGKACTTCRSGVYWCDSGLCRGDCSSPSSQCSCEANCSGVNRDTCTCPNSGGSNGNRMANYNSDASPVVSKGMFSVFLTVLAAMVL